MTNNRASFPPINLMIQNVQSLNISTMCKKTSKKIFSITREKDDIILLSDIRLNSSKQVSAILDIKKRFAFRGYDFLFNSTRNSRGVGILISKKIPYQIHNEYMDGTCNLFLLDITICNKRLTLGAVYGPNLDDENFFRTLGTGLQQFANNCV